MTFQCLLPISMWLIACNFSADPVFSQLSQDLKKSRKAAFATGTSKNQRTQWRTYLYFTLHFNLVFLPASLQTICLYCQFLSRSMTPPSVRNFLSGVKLLHLMLGFELPDLSVHEIKITLRGIERLALHRPHRAPRITPSLLSTLVSCRVDFDPSDVTFSCAFLFAFFLFARISNLVPDSFKASHSEAHERICRGDLSLTHYRLCVQFTWSKTVQFGQRILELPLVRVPNSSFVQFVCFILCASLSQLRDLPPFLSSPLVWVDCAQSLRLSLFK